MTTLESGLPSTLEKVERDVSPKPADISTVIDVPDTKTATVDEDEVDDGFNHYFRIFKYADKLDWILNIIALLCAVASGTALPLSTIIFGSSVAKFNSFDLSAADQFRKDVNHYTLWFVYLFVGRFTVTYIANTCITISAIRTTRAIRQVFLEHLLRMDISYHDKQSNGSAATQITTNGNRINSGIAEKLILVITSISMFLSAFIVALAVQWKLALITMSIIPLILIVTSICIAIDSKNEAKIMKLYSRGSTLAQEAFSSIRTVHAFWAHQKILEQFDTYLQAAHTEGNKKSWNYGILFSTEYLCTYSGTALAFWQGFRMKQRGEIANVGIIFTVELSVLMAAQSMSVLAPQLIALTNAAAAASELFSIIDKPSMLDPLKEDGLKPERCVGDIVLTDVNFAYPSRPTAQVLQDFSLTIPAGKTTALVGPSGSGKSTIVGLIERWYDPTSGTIKLDGTEISDFNLKWLRCRVRLVQQEPVLFSGTVFENVAKGFLDEQRLLNLEEQTRLVEEACVQSNAHNFIKHLPNGYHSHIGERAGMLSGGQKQRIAIARSIISKPQILLLDEATSALDPAAESVVTDALKRVSKDRTTISIAHRLSTIKEADNIAVLANGKIVEQGTHNDLISRNGHYAALVRAQNLGDDGHDEKERRHSIDADEKVDDKLLNLTNTKSVQKAIIMSDEEKTSATKGTVGYSLIRCVFLMLREQKALFPQMAIVLIACMIGGAIYPVQAILFSRVLEVFNLTGEEASRRADFWALMFFILALASVVSYFPLGYIVARISQEITHKYRYEMLKRILAQDMSFFDFPENASGALTAKLGSQPQDLQELMSLNIPLLAIIVFNLLGSSILALVYGWKLSLVVLVGGLVPLVAAGYYRIRLEMILDNANGERFSTAASIASEAIVSIRTVASLALEREVLGEFSDRLGNIVTQSGKTVLARMAFYSISQSLDPLILALGFWYGSRLLASGEYTSTQFYVIFIGVLFSGQAAGQFFGYSTSFTKAVGAANYILWLRTLRPVMAENDANTDIGPNGDGDIQFENVEFAYPQRREAKVIRGIDMTIKPGDFVAFVGASGHGKTTMISLLERFYDPTSGRICLGSDDIKYMSPRKYRSHLSIVQQEPTLYQGTVRQNITLGLSYTPSQKEVDEACKTANAYDFIMSLPEGYETPCGTHGMQFSGGQRQRIAISRALITRPRVLLLDESTSALDTQSEKLILAAFEQARSAHGRITVSVAHRLSTIFGADRIYCFANGKIAEMGTHEDLVAMRGRYWEMCRAQSLDRNV